MYSFDMTSEQKMLVDTVHRYAADQLRAVYEEQAALGIPEAVRGLERMDRGRWPSDGSPRKRDS